MDNISVVYKIGNNKKWGEFECLRYSIRSVVKNFKNLGDIFIIGTLPSWAQNIIHIPATDPSKSKDINIITKMLIAANDDRVSENFLNCSDDNLMIYPVSVSMLKAFTIDSDLRRMEKGRGISAYGRRVQNTISALKKQGILKPNLFEGHIPYLINKQKYIEIISKYPDYTKGSGYCSNTIYFNNLITSGEQPVENVRAFLKRSYKLGQIIDECRGKLFLGYQKRALNENLKNFMKQRFPEKSIYEK